VTRGATVRRLLGDSLAAYPATAREHVGKVCHTTKGWWFTMQAPRTSAQIYALFAGAILLGFGVIALAVGHTDFGTGANLGGDEFIIWMANGWDTIVWMALGALGLMAAARAETATAYSMLAGAFFVLVAVWGFISGNDVFGLMAVDTTDNISHAAIGAAGVVAALSPDSLRRTKESRQFGSGGHATHA